MIKLPSDKRRPKDSSIAIPLYEKLLLLLLLENSELGFNTLNSFCPVFFSLFIPHYSRSFDTMSELTERSKCVFQAKLAEQAERYDGTTTITFRFMCAYALFTRARVYIFVLNWNHQIGSFCSIIFSFKRASFGCVYTCKETNTIAFSILTILLTQCRDDRGFEETVRDSGY